MTARALLASMVLAILLAGGGYYAGWRDRDNEAQIAAGRQIEQSHQQAVAEQQPAIVAAKQLEVANANERVIYQTITKQVDRVVDRPIYRDRCIDDDGLRLARAAIAGEVAAAAEPAGAVPGPDNAR